MQIGANTDQTGAGYRWPALDGVRGLAVVLVLFHHCVIWSGIGSDVWIDREIYRLANSSWLGVDLFFVLSGFLITGILYDAKGSRAYFRSFYGRRVLRIFPLYYGFLALALLLGPLVLSPRSYQSLVESQGWYWFYLSNVKIAIDGWQHPLHLGHLWSLAIEEQFYLLWPLAVWALNRKVLLRLTVACFVLALAIRIVKPFDLSMLDAYVLLPTRMDALAAGAFVALLVRGEQGTAILKSWSVECLLASTLALALIYGRYRVLNSEGPVVGEIGFSIIAIASASGIACLLQAASTNRYRRLFSSRPLVALGRYSYALYLVHVPIVLFLMDHGLRARLFPRFHGSTLPGVLVFSACAFGLALLFAMLSYRFFEKPILSLKRYLPHRGASKTHAERSWTLSTLLTSAKGRRGASQTPG